MQTPLNTETPATPDDWTAVARRHVEEGNPGEAVKAFAHALELDPDHVAALCGMASLIFDARTPRRAYALIEKALSLDPKHADAHRLLGTFYLRLRDLKRAEAALNEAIALNPRDKEAYKLLHALLGRQGRAEVLRASVKEYLDQYPDDLKQRSAGLFINHYFEPEDRHTELQELREWQKYAPKPDSPDVFRNDRNPDRRLRIGYLSPDFRWHAVAHFALPVLEGHDPKEVEIFCYSETMKVDARTHRFQEAADHWINTRKLSDTNLRDRIREDRIDILIELAGHSAGNRLRAVAMRCAPIQAHWLGFCNSTGLDAMDYRLSDAIADPPGVADEVSSEEIVRLPEGFFVYLPPEESPPVRPAPCLRNEFVTFGCFNNYLKTNEKVVALWARLMKEVPGSRLLLRYGGYESPYLRQVMMERFEGHGIASERVRLLESTPAILQHYDLHGQVDIALDPFPYNGMTTSCDVLWMGVPLVTLQGKLHRSRVGACMLTRIGHPEWIAKSEDEYVDIAKNLAADPEQLNAIRPRIREAMRQSPLMDGPRLAGHIERAYRDWWQRWIRRAARGS